MEISGKTKIAQLLKENPAALDAIVSISSKFEKLRNPLLRRVMAPRTTIETAAKMGGCSVADFFDKLRPLGFSASATAADDTPATNKPIPSFIASVKQEDVLVFDVRPIIAGGDDPLKLIMEKIAAISAGQALKIINSFEPLPLMLLLEKKGFQVYVEQTADEVFFTYFYKPQGLSSNDALPAVETSGDWSAVLNRFSGNLVTIDVRELEMPGPMMKILETIHTLAPQQALFVHHKRVPVFLLPELAERGMDYRINTIAEGDVKMLIYHKKPGK